MNLHPFRICALLVALPIAACGAPAEQRDQPEDESAAAPAPGGKADGYAACELPAEPGPCEALEDRWYYDTESGSCQPFVYGGCEGNANNFGSAEDCEQACAYEEPAQDPDESPNVCEARENWSYSQQKLIDRCIETGRNKVVEQAAAYGCSLDADDVVASDVDDRAFNPYKYIWYLGCAQCPEGERVIQKTVQYSFGKCY